MNNLGIEHHKYYGNKDCRCILKVERWFRFTVEQEQQIDTKAIVFNKDNYFSESFKVNLLRGWGYSHLDDSQIS